MPDEKRLNLKTDRLDELGQMLDRQLQRQLDIRMPIEQRWLEDLRQYHGKYSEDVETILRRQEEQTGSSAIFVNLTRPKCDTTIARFTDTLFPTDDKNWTIQPTPDPELSELESDESEEVAGAASVENEQAKAGAKAMTREIDDQLTEAKYAAKARDVIEDGVKLGTGIVEGPIVVGRVRKAWKKVDAGVYNLEIIKDQRPGIDHVSPWDFVPDMSGRCIEECEYFYRRRYLTRRKLAALAGQPGYMKDQIKNVLQSGADWNSEYSSGDDNIQRLREISGVFDGSLKNRFELWKFTGELERELMLDVGLLPDSKADDPFAQMHVEIYFCNGIVIKAVSLPLDTDEPAYSVFNWIKSEGSVYGYGLPYVMRASQEIANKSWRAMLDNAALSVGPQVVANQAIIEPADGVWTMTPRKTWFLTDKTLSVNEAFATFDISSYQPELQNIFQQAIELSDMETAIPRIQTGDLTGTPAQTATAAAMYMNASLIVYKKAVKNWDDDITVPLISRFYDYNMQYSDDEDIKGDFEVDARGSSALLVKETQVPALLGLMAYANDPTYGPLTKAAALYRKAVEAQRINPDDVIYTDEEIAQAQANQPPPQPSIDEQKIAIDQEKNQIAREKNEQDKNLKTMELGLRYSADAEKLQAEQERTTMVEETKRSEQDLKLVMGSGI